MLCSIKPSLPGWIFLYLSRRICNYKLISFFHDYVEKENDFNYIPIGKLELYDLENDIGETNNLVDSLPGLAKDLQKKLYLWIEETGAEIPGLNEDYNSDSVYIVKRPKGPPIDFPESPVQ